MTVAIVAIVLVIILVAILASARGRNDFDFPGWFIVIWCIWAVVCLSVTGLVIYVAWHFVAKYW